MRLQEYLTRRNISFTELPHYPAYTASRLAQVLHVPGKEVAKTVVIRSNGGYAVVVVPATHQVDLDRVRQLLNARDVEMASEDEMDQLFPDCERGAIPPFGSLYQLPTLVDEALTEDERFVFEANSHQEAIRMSYRDFENLEHPRTARLAHHI